MLHFNTGEGYGAARWNTGHLIKSFVQHLSLSPKKPMGSEVYRVQTTVETVALVGRLQVVTPIEVIRRTKF